MTKSAYETGKAITGIKEAEESGAMVFHAGTSSKNGEIVTSGGRVMGITALGEDTDKARTKAYEAVSKMHFEGIHFRKDIGL